MSRWVDTLQSHSTPAMKRRHRFCDTPTYLPKKDGNENKVSMLSYKYVPTTGIFVVIPVIQLECPYSAASSNFSKASSDFCVFTPPTCFPYIRDLLADELCVKNTNLGEGALRSVLVGYGRACK